MTILDIHPNKLWQVLCGDDKHWRVGVYSPDIDAVDKIETFESHSCPEFFILLSGELSISHN